MIQGDQPDSTSKASRRVKQSANAHARTAAQSEALNQATAEAKRLLRQLDMALAGQHTQAPYTQYGASGPANGPPPFASPSLFASHGSFYNAQRHI